MTRGQTDYQAPAPAEGRGRNYALPARATRLPLVAAMIIGVVAAGTLRHVAVAYQDDLSARPMAAAGGRGASASALGSMNSFALALLLGGLRGPLAMILWATSENQKADRNLEDFDTKVEWIRLLQPEFDTVHMFQIWNKAYNISVQMASLQNRFAAILDALDYAADVDQQRPGDLNIINAVAQVYSNKLGTPHTEKVFYRRWVREQSFAPADYVPGQGQDRSKQKGQGAWQRRRMDPKLYGKNPDGTDHPRRGYLLPEVIDPKPGMARPADLPANSEWNDGSELQYLKPYEPFPYGVSTFALAYNYAKRAQVLMTVGNQTPLQLSETVIDSRPAVEMNQWVHDEWERGRQFELQAAGLPVPNERLQMEMPTAGMPTAQRLADADAVAPAIYSYDMTARVAADAVAEYNRHMSNPKYVDRSMPFGSHIDEMTAIGHMAAADRDYVKAVAEKDAAAREPLLRAAAENYQRAIGDFQLVLLKYYVDDEMIQTVAGKEQSRETVKNLPRADQDRIMAGVRQLVAQRPRDQNADDYDEYFLYLTRANTRLGLMLRR